MGIYTQLKKQKTQPVEEESRLKELAPSQRKSLFTMLETAESMGKYGLENESKILITHYYDMLETYKALGYDVWPYLKGRELLKN